MSFTVEACRYEELLSTFCPKNKQTYERVLTNNSTYYIFLNILFKKSSVKSLNFYRRTINIHVRTCKQNLQVI